MEFLVVLTLVTFLERPGIWVCVVYVWPVIQVCKYILDELKKWQTWWRWRQSVPAGGGPHRRDQPSRLHVGLQKIAVRRPQQTFTHDTQMQMVPNDTMINLLHWVVLLKTVLLRHFFSCLKTDLFSPSTEGGPWFDGGGWYLLRVRGPT